MTLSSRLRALPDTGIADLIAAVNQNCVGCNWTMGYTVASTGQTLVSVYLHAESAEIYASLRAETLEEAACMVRAGRWEPTKRRAGAA